MVRRVHGTLFALLAVGVAMLALVGRPVPSAATPPIDPAGHCAGPGCPSAGATGDHPEPCIVRVACAGQLPGASTVVPVLAVLGTAWILAAAGHVRRVRLADHRPIDRLTRTRLFRPPRLAA
jgi:hypothetical protein